MRPLPRLTYAAALAAVLAAPCLPAQPRATERGGPPPTLAGEWQGTASVPLGDSTITVPVFYTFAPAGGGMAAVPGQGSGPISNVVRSGRRVQFRVTATPLPTKPVPGKPAPLPPTPRTLEHDGAFTADGAIEGMVNLDQQPIAKFRIVPKPAVKK